MSLMAQSSKPSGAMSTPLLIRQQKMCALDQHSLVEHSPVNSVNATGGILIACVGLLIFELKKIPVTDYLPSLIFAPLLTWLLLR
jgi:uncharacterized membrane protein YqgA involved in biofilm formation